MGYANFYNSKNGDRKYNADSLAQWLRKFFTNGVFNGELQVTSTGGMGVSVSAGYACVNGRSKFFETASIFTVQTAHSTFPRIDTIVMEANDSNRDFDIKYIVGQVSGATPQATPPVRSGNIYQLVLAQIRVNAGVTSITDANITDTRANNSLCGYVRGTVDQIDWSQFTSQFEAYYEEFKAENLGEFETWFQHMKDQLDSDAAGHLQGEVDVLTGRIQGVETYLNGMPSGAPQYNMIRAMCLREISASTLTGAWLYPLSGGGWVPVGEMGEAIPDNIYISSGQGKAMPMTASVYVYQAGKTSTHPELGYDGRLGVIKLDDIEISVGGERRIFKASCPFYSLNGFVLANISIDTAPAGDLSSMPTWGFGLEATTISGDNRERYEGRIKYGIMVKVKPPIIIR